MLVGGTMFTQITFLPQNTENSSDCSFISKSTPPSNWGRKFT